MPSDCNSIFPIETNTSDNNKLIGVVFYPDGLLTLKYVHNKNEDSSEIAKKLFKYSDSSYEVSSALCFREALLLSNEFIQKIKQIKLSLIVFDMCTGMHFYPEFSKLENYKQIIPRDLFLKICGLVIMMFKI